MSTRRGVLRFGGALAATAGSAVALSACGAAQSGTPANTGNPQSLPPASIRFMRRSGEPPGQEPTLFAEQIPLFQAKYPNIKVIDEQVAPGAEFYDKFTVLATAGSLGDVTWASVGQGGIYNLAAQKTLLALDSLVASQKVDLGQYYKGCVDGLKRDGKLYGLPFKAHPGVSILFYNETEFQRAGAGIPDKSWTLDRFLDAAKRVTKPAENVYGYNPATSQKTILTFVRAFGGELLDAEGKKSLLNSPQAIAAITWMYEAFNRHNIAPKPSIVTPTFESVDKAFTTGKLASGKWGTSFQATAARDVKDSFKWFASLHPKGPGNVGGSDYEIDSMSITATSKFPQQSFEWVKWLTNQESGIRLGEIGGTVGGRPDVYKSERLLKDPVRKVFLEAMDTAQAGRAVYNTRMVEYERVIENGLRPVWEGQQAPSKGFMDELTRQVQVVLDQPLP